MAPHSRELALLRTLISVVNSSLELEHLLSHALDILVEFQKTDLGGRMLLVDPENQGLKIVAHRGKASQTLPERIFGGEWACGKVLESGMPLFDCNCPNADCQCGESGQSGCNQLVYPLLARHSVVGVGCLFYPCDVEIDVSDLSLWADIGKLLGKAVQDAKLNGQVETQRDLLQVLYDVSNHLATSLDLDWVLSRVLELAVSATEANDGSIFLLPSAGTSTPRILRRDLAPEKADLVIDQVVGQGLAGWVVRNRIGTIVADTSRDPRWLSFSDESDPPGSALAVPLMADERVLGVLTLTIRRPTTLNTSTCA